MTLSLPAIQRSRSLHEQIYATLRAGILAGDLAPGDRLVETQLAEQLGVSRTPIREAIRQLQRETLVSADASGNLRVTTITPSDAAQLYDCRMALEQLSVHEACQHATEADLRAIESLILEAERLLGQSSTPQYSPEMLDLDYRFHRQIAESSGNHWLVTLLDQVFDKMALLRVQTTRHNPDVLEIRDEHRRIYEAIAQRNPTTATTAIHTHLSASKTRVIQEVELLQRES